MFVSESLNFNATELILMFGMKIFLQDWDHSGPMRDIIVCKINFANNNIKIKIL